MISKTIPANMSSLFKEFPDLRRVETDGRHRLKARRPVLRLAPKHGVGAEIGVYTGIFSEVLAEITEPKQLYLVDPWEKLHGPMFPNWKDFSAQQSLDTEAAMAAVSYRAKHISANCEVVHDFFEKWLANFSEPFLDWVYLDAKHTYDFTLNALNQLSGYLNRAGVLMGDDCWIKKGHVYSETYRAVRDFVDSTKFVLVHLDQNGQWAITHKSNTEKAMLDE